MVQGQSHAWMTKDAPTVYHNAVSKAEIIAKSALPPIQFSYA